MNKEEVMGKLQMVYVGDLNALGELIGYYDGLKQGIEELQQENKELNDSLTWWTNRFNAVERDNRELKEDYARKVQDNCYTLELEQRIDKAIEYMQDFIFEGLLVNEDRKLIMYNQNLRKFEEILKGDNNE